jgi:hypothetical protein
MTTWAIRTPAAAPVHGAGSVKAWGGVEPFNTRPCGPRQGVDSGGGRGSQPARVAHPATLKAAPQATPKAALQPITKNVHWEGVS